MVGLRFTVGNIMGNKRNWRALAAIICSIVPIGHCAVLVALFLSLSSAGDSCMPGSDALLLLPVGFIIFIVMIAMGIISIVLGIIAIRKPETRGKTLSKVAIVLGILEIVIVIGCFLFIIILFLID
jgi:hypothetical protein